MKLRDVEALAEAIEQGWEAKYVFIWGLAADHADTMNPEVAGAELAGVCADGSARAVAV